jgi:ferrous iron transport protein A
MSKIHLANLLPGQMGTISLIEAEECLQQRLMALGFRSGKQIEMIRCAWLSGPLHVRIGTTEVMVRRRDAKEIYLTNVCQSEKSIGVGK